MVYLILTCLQIIGGNAHPFQGDLEPPPKCLLILLFRVVLVNRLRITESIFLCTGNILVLVFTSTIDQIGDVNILCPFPIVGIVQPFLTKYFTFPMN